MSVIPYIACALVHGVGRLSIDEAKRLVKKGWPYFILIWFLTLSLIYSLKGMLPSSLPSSPMHHETLRMDQTPFDFIEAFIPTNFFKALANDIIPSIVVFCLIFGASLIKLPNKNALLNPLDTAIAGLNRVSLWVSYLGPIGAFALMASITGTIQIGEIDKIQLYLLAVFIGSLFLALWLFPMIVVSFTEIRYKDLLNELPTVFLLAFTAANPLIAFPFIIKAVKNLATKYSIPEQDSQKTCEAVVPIALNFPTAGNFFALLFILFLAFYYGLDLSLTDYAKLNSIGFIILFGPSTQISSAISYLMNLLQIPADGHTLYVNSFFVIRYFIALVSVSGVAALTILIVFSYGKKIHIKTNKLLKTGFFSILILGSVMISSRYFDLAPKHVIPSFARLKIDMIVPVSVNLTAVKPLELTQVPEGLKEDALDRIQKTKTLRVGYNPHTMPFAYFNNENDLVGFDIAIAYQLAYSLGAQLELVPFTSYDLRGTLQADIFDIAMSGILTADEQSQDYAISKPYMKGLYCLVVRDFQRDKYNNYARVKSRKGLKIAVLNRGTFPKMAQQLFPNSETILIDHVQEFMKPYVADALFWTEESALPWTLFNPQFIAVNPSPGLAKASYSYLMATHSPKLKAFVDKWLIDQSEFVEGQYKYWFANEAITTESRWCIIKDVLHWVN